MKILKNGGVVEKKGEEETKSMPHAPVAPDFQNWHLAIFLAPTFWEQEQPLSMYHMIVKTIIFRCMNILKFNYNQ